MTTTYNTRIIPNTSVYNNNERVSAYYLIDEEGNFIIDEEGNYILIIGEGSDGLPLSDYYNRTIPNSAIYKTRNPI